MQFHPEKCQVLRVSKKSRSNTLNHSYTLHGHTLEVVDHAKYLGVTISGNLKWDRHISNITKKANSSLAVLKRNVRVPSKVVKSAAYKALVRPHLEYCSTVWDPNTKCLKDKLEMVQRRSARWVFNKYRCGLNTTGPTEMISILGWPLLETRRRIARMCLIYKMRENLTLMSYCSLLKPYPYVTQGMPAHAFVPLDKMPHRVYYSTSFFPRSVAEWNSLPADLFTSVTSLESFKTSVRAVVV